MAVVHFVSWNAERLTRRLPRRILAEYGPALSYQLQQEISKEQFYWPVTTRRKNGRVIKPGDRDIVDTGTLLNSQTEPTITDNGALSVLQISWTAPYSGVVLRGNYLVGTVRNSYIAPPRDWITPAFKEQPLLPFFKNRWGKTA